jgi:hypothetical protein
VRSPLQSRHRPGARIFEHCGRTGGRRLQRGGNQTDHDRCLKLREIIRKASGETIDIKAYAADMRHLIDTYIEAGAPRKISPFDDMTLLELIVKSGIAATYGA